MKRLTHSLIAATVFFAACDAWAVTKFFTQTTAPATCTVGDLWVDTNGTSGERLYTCESTNTWSLHLGVGPTSNPSFLSLNVSGGNLAAANKQVTKAWATGLPYTANVTSVIHGGNHYICTSTHTAGSTTEPGVGASWATVWSLATGSGDDLGSATYSDVVGLWTTCSGYLHSDGTCGTPSGSFSWPTSDGAYYAAKDGAWASLATVYQPLDSDLTTWAGVTSTANGRSLVSAANYAAMRTLLDLEAGTDFNAYDADLATLASPTNWRVFYSNGSGVVTQLALGADGTYLKSNGASAAPTWATPSGTMVYPGAGIPNSTGSAWGSSYSLDTNLITGVSASDDSIPSAKAVDALVNSLPTLAAGTGITITEDGGGAGIDTVNVTTNTYQAYDADLTTYAGITPSANVQSLLGAANYAAMRTLLDLEAGTDFNAYDADVADLADGSLTGSKVSAASDTAVGVVELAIASEVNTGTDTGRAVTPDALAGSNLGSKEIGWVIVKSDTVTAVADGKDAIAIPSSMNGMNLVDVTCSVSDLNSAASGATTVVLRRVRGATAVDMTSTGVTIGYNEYTASDETVDTANDDVQTGDKIFADVNAVTTAVHKGLYCTAVFQLP